MRADRIVTSAMKKATYRDLLQQIGKHRRSYLTGLAYLAVSSFLAFLIPLIGRYAIDGIIAGDAKDLPATVAALIRFFGGRGHLAQNLWIAGTLLVAASSLSGLFLYWHDKATAHASESICRDLRNQLYDRLHRLPCAFYAEAETGDLIQRCTSDVETIRIFLNKQVVEIGRTAVMLILVVPMMLSLHVPMTALSLQTIPVMIGFSLLFFRRIQSVFREVEVAEGAMTTAIQENLSGIRVVRAFAQQDFECEKFAAFNADYRDREMVLARLLARFWGTTELICLTQTALVLFVGGWLAVQSVITVGILFAFIAYSGMILWPIRHTGRILADTGKALVAFGRIAEILKEPPETEIGEKPTGFPGRLVGAITFENVSFSYRSDKPAIRNLTCRIRPGETIAVIGPTGSGKSTLIRLLLRLYDYRQGSIKIDGFELNRIDRKLIRSQIGSVLQEPFLFARSLRDNIKLGNPAADDRAMKKATEAACVHDSIMGLGQGYDTVVGERGVTLSGGQAQRVTLARTLLKDASILILDDSLSAVDSATERTILDMLEERYGHRTTIVVTHRLACCLRADRILVLEGGRLVQQGPHKELIAKPGFYQNVWNIQNVLDRERRCDKL